MFSDCPNCSKKYRTVDQLKLHLFRCDKMQCKLCDFKTYKSYNLKRHFQISHQAPEELTMCMLSEYKFHVKL